MGGLKLDPEFVFFFYEAIPPPFLAELFNTLNLENTKLRRAGRKIMLT